MKEVSKYYKYMDNKNTDFTHFNEKGKAFMVNVGEKMKLIEQQKQCVKC